MPNPQSHRFFLLYIPFFILFIVWNKILKILFKFNWPTLTSTAHLIVCPQCLSPSYPIPPPTLYSFFQKLYSSAFNVQVYEPFRVNFYERFMFSANQFFARMCSLVLVPLDFVELSSLLCQKYLRASVSGFLFCSIYFSILLSLPHYAVDP